MIMIAAGTQDGRELTGLLLEHSYKVIASVVSHYGSELLKKYGDNLVINEQPLDENGLEKYFKLHDVKIFIDASHPYAINVSKNAIAVCQKLNVSYIRYERNLTDLTKTHNVIVVDSYQAAIKAAADLGNNIFLTTGSRNLEKFTATPELKNKNIIARVLPTAEVVALCEKLGLTPASIVALQGPFSKELNLELFRRYNADLIITKNSGSLGGTDTKLAAASALSLPIIVIDRPKLDYPQIGNSYEDILKFVEENH